MMMNHRRRRIHQRLWIKKTHIVVFSFVVDFFGDLGFSFLIDKSLPSSLSSLLFLLILPINAERNTIMTTTVDSATISVYKVFVVKKFSCFVIVVLRHFVNCLLLICRAIWET